MSRRVRWTHAFVDRPLARFDRACAFWTAVTDPRLSERRGERQEFVTLLPDDAHAAVKVQGVVSGEGGAHPDFAVENVPAFVEASLRRGASLVAGHARWAVLGSPAGQPFCVGPWERGESVRPPVVRGSRLDQVCLDVPPSAFDAEVGFWSGLLDGWESRPGSPAEFHVLVQPAGLPIRVLLQRLDGEREPGAHLDLACAEVEATRAEHERLGARFVARHSTWTVMRDPAGGLYCLTGRHPECVG
ncbi:VOC family protein [Streptomyces sp. 7R007]